MFLNTVFEKKKKKKTGDDIKKTKIDILQNQIYISLKDKESNAVS